MGTYSGQAGSNEFIVFVSFLIGLDDICEARQSPGQPLIANSLQHAPINLAVSS